tara:strand:- start:228 stop:665 length:438 start_codon:yes stop_codon:yes gene_type:complete
LKITKSQLKQIIKEELIKVLTEGSVHDNQSPVSGRPDPRFGRMTVLFDSDVDKALYIVYNAIKKSKREPEFLQWLSSLGYTQQQMTEEGEKIKDILKQQIVDHPDFPGWSGWSQMTGDLRVPTVAGEPETGSGEILADPPEIFQT